MIVKDLLLFLLSWIIPKDENKILFATTNKYSLSSNLECLSNHFQQHGFRLYILYDNKLLYKSGREIKSSILKLCILSRSNVIFIDYNISNIFRIGYIQYFSNINIIQLWHGTGFKNIAIM